METDTRFGIVDYVVFALMFVVSAGVGLYHAFSGGGQKTTDQYLMGNREMGVIPITLSLAVSFVSAVTLQGVPAEVYTNGIQFVLYAIGINIGTVLTAVTFAPLYFPLRLTSINEYLEMRFKSRSVRMLGCIYLMVTQCAYVGCLVFGPATALEVATGLHPIWSILIVNIVGTIYTSLGGMKAVVWTDVFQAGVMLAGIIFVIILGSIKQGGMDEVMDTNREWGRVFFSYSIDPTTRMSVWTTTLFSGVFLFGAYGCNQPCTQRYIAMTSVRNAQLSLILTGLLFMCFHICAVLAGMVVFSYYADLGCDPVSSGQLSNSNQLLPQFVLEVLHYPGIPGLFLACLFSGSFSSLSSSINSVAAVMWDDILKNYLQHLSEERKATVSRGLAFGFGIVCLCMSFIVWAVGGNLSVICLSLLGSILGPMLGMYLLGAAVPWSNWIGTLVGGMISCALTLWLLLGSIFHGGSANPLPTPTDQCYVDGHNSTFFNTSSSYLSSTHYYHTTTVVTDDISKDLSSRSAIDWIYSVSFQWYPFIGTAVCMIIGVLVSLATGLTNPDDIESRLLFTFLRSRYGSPSPIAVPTLEEKEDLANQAPEVNKPPLTSV